jgi:hypothetical protein
MARYKYTGTDERVFPTLGLTLKQDDEFDAPDNFNVYQCDSVGAKISTKPTTVITPSATPDTTQGV